MKLGIVMLLTIYLTSKEIEVVSAEYDEYRAYVRSVSDEELYYEAEDTFAQISDEDEGIKYALCAEEQNRRGRGRRLD